MENERPWVLPPMLLKLRPLLIKYRSSSHDPNGERFVPAMSGTHEKEVVSPVTLYLRATADLVKAARPYQSRVTLHCDGKAADGRDMMDVMGLFVAQGARVKVRAEGPDARDCVEALVLCIGGLVPK